MDLFISRIHNSPPYLTAAGMMVVTKETLLGVSFNELRQESVHIQGLVMQKNKIVAIPAKNNCAQVCRDICTWGFANRHFCSVYGKKHHTPDPKDLPNPDMNWF